MARKALLLGFLIAALWLGPAEAASAPPAAAPKDTTASARERSGAAPRRLDDVHIEGEIPVPQVLFVTARDQRRFMHSRHRRYLKTSLMIGQETILPSWIALTGHDPEQNKSWRP